MERHFHILPYIRRVMEEGSGRVRAILMVGALYRSLQSTQRGNNEEAPYRDNGNSNPSSSDR